MSRLPGEPVLRKSQSQVQLRWDGFGEKVVGFGGCLSLAPLGTAMAWSFSACIHIHCKVFGWASCALRKGNWEITVCKKQVGAFSTHYVCWLGYFYEDSYHLHVHAEQSTWTLFYHFLAYTVMLNSIRWYFILPWRDRHCFSSILKCLIVGGAEYCHW